MNIVVALSGGGRTLENLLNHQGKFHICGVISSNATCRGNEVARLAGLRLFEGTPEDLSGKNNTLLSWLNDSKADYVVLAGYLKKFPLLPGYVGKTINIHPALLPKFGGKGYHGDHVHRAVIASGDSKSGATVHVVTKEYDQGKILGQIEVPVLEDDSIESLSSRVFVAECQLYPMVLNSICDHQGDLENWSLMKVFYVRCFKL